MRQSGSMRGVWKQGPRYGCSDTARRKGRKRIRRTYSSLRHTPTLPLKPLRAGTSGDSGVLVYSCAFLPMQSAHEAAGATGTRRSPRPLRGREIHARLGRIALRGREVAFGIGLLKIEPAAKYERAIASAVVARERGCDLILRSAPWRASRRMAAGPWGVSILRDACFASSSG